jgi:hypothetical protein
MHPGRSIDFSYTYFRQLLHTSRSYFTAYRLSQAPDILQSANTHPALFLRHDVKISLQHALPMAEIEHEYNLPATYMIRVDSPLYSLAERSARVHLLELIQMGHEVGLHFDLASAEPQSQSFLEIIDMRLRTACERLEQIICCPVRSISLQRPMPLLFNGPLLIQRRVNADSRELRNWYVSDTGGDWHEQNLLSRTAKPQKQILQFVLHPIWWGETYLSAPQRLQGFFELTTKDKGPREAGIFDIHLAKTLPEVRRQGIYELLSRGGRI